jgi:hypothetical protein
MSSQNLQARLRDYSLLTGSILLAVADADSQIVYHYYNNPLSVYDDYLDINNDGLYDLYFDSYVYENDYGTYETSSEIYSWFAKVSLSAINNCAIAVTPYELRKLNAGQLINSSLSWCECKELLAQEEMVYDPYFHSYDGYWFGEVKGLFGFRLKEGTDKYYGWMRMSVYTGYCVIYDYAYSAVPNQPILAGDVGCEWLNSSVDVIPGETVCNGDTITLVASPPEGYVYSWKKVGTTSLPGSNNATYKVTQGSGDYFVVVSIPNICYDTSEVVHVEHIEPQVPDIYFINDTLFSSLPNVYQWYFNSEPIAGATEYYYVPSQPGTYTVVTNEGDCYTSSPPYYFLSTNSVILSSSTYPNILVENSNLVVMCDPVKKQSRQYIITDLLGRTFIQLTSSENNFIIPINQLSAGEYLLVILDEKKRTTFPFIKN